MGKKLSAILLTCMLALSLLVVNAQPAYAATKAKVKSITVTNLPVKTLTVAKGKSKTLKVKVAVSSKSVSKNIKVTVKNKKYVTAKVSGSKVTITGKKAGKTTVTIAAKADSKKKVAITVTVGTPVSGIKLNTKTATLYTGRTTTLKATVTNKKASNKKVVWTSSKKSVATVSSKGVVTGKAVGTATITATAADGSGKKASCKVTVKKSNSIASVAVIDMYTVRVTLADAQKLDASKFKVFQKEYDRGTYGYRVSIDDVTTSDNKNYYITLKKNKLELESGVQVSVTGLTGTKGAVSKDTVYSYGKKTYTSSSVVGLLCNARVSQSVYVSSDEGYYGSVSCTVSGLPSGLKIASRYASGVTVGGTPTKTGTYNTVFTFKDELGNTYKVTRTYLVYDTSTLLGCADEVYTTLDSDGTQYVYANVHAYGGSGSYTYSIVGSNTDFSVSSSGYVCGTVKKAGTTKVAVKVTDQANSKRTKTVTLTINAAKSYTLSGTVKTADGKDMYDGYVVITNTDPTSKYVTRKGVYVYDGKYSVQLPAGTYKIATWSQGYESYEYKYIGTQKISGNTTKNITTPFYEVSIAETSQISDYDTWYDANNVYVGEGSTLYLKPGTYKLHTEGETILGTYTATVNVTVTNKSVTVKPSVSTKQTISSTTITVNQEFSTSLENSNTYFKFTPTTTGTYYFYNTESAHVDLAIYNSQGTYITGDSWHASGYYYTYATLTAGNTYYLSASLWYSSGTSMTTVKFALSDTNPYASTSED